MYGYVVPDKTTIKQEEFVLFSAFYCGVCVAIGNKFGQVLRYTTNYDIAFFAALIFDQLNGDAQFEQTKCIGNPFTNKPIIKQNDLLNRIADVNIILAYYKLLDNLLDGKRGAKTAVKFIKKHFLSAAEREPEAAEICLKAHNALHETESRNEKSFDIAADCFAGELRDLTRLFLGENQNALNLCYNIGKFVYLADALDDIGEDANKGAFNPFLRAFDGGSVGGATLAGGFVSREKFIADHYGELSFALVSTVNRAIESFNGIKFNQSYGLLENIVYYGLRAKTDELLKSKKKLKRPKF